MVRELRGDYVGRETLSEPDSRRKGVMSGRWLLQVQKKEEEGDCTWLLAITVVGSSLDLIGKGPQVDTKVRPWSRRTNLRAVTDCALLSHACAHTASSDTDCRSIS